MTRAALSLTLLCGCEPTNQGYAPAQPISYSHAVHAGAMQVPCQYCHFSAEHGPHAGIPPAQVCMNCHKQVLPEHPEILKVSAALRAGTPIEWARVNWLPDHAFFDHGIHVTAGVECQRCHGDVQAMGRVEQAAPLTMGFCVDCHRDVSQGPAGRRTQASALTDCAVCHH